MATGPGPATERLTDSGRLTGKVALVTGAGQGIGRGIALALAREGAAVALAGRTVAKCEAVVAEIDAFGGRALALACDASERAQVDAAVGAAVSAFGGLDALVNNAATSVQGPLAELTEADVDDCWRNGALATFHGMQAALPHLRARGGGSIVNFGSNTAITGVSTFGAYAMAKEAIRGLSRVAAREWGRYNIRVNVVVPNALSPSAETFAREHPDHFARMQQALTLRRVGDPEADIGRAVVALVSDDLAYLTADTLMLTGGGI
ncbi:Short-chain dehydrogenase [Frankia canadensis]|uniref:Short-chain dehydrogenase n=1 Tax=Frankia canadensis TaxID=1836972 RepID=A0A2I2KU58_9ACTN|nr:SDR family oxidoreductase [Frankia canadensis]SNQ49197.1 Short-chain dehydrogenase [Frankia canadensis]SOU56487.1 Short-chain dehydrogenase [Frankia canadensis]